MQSTHITLIIAFITYLYCVVPISASPMLKVPQQSTSILQSRYDKNHVPKTISHMPSIDSQSLNSNTETLELGSEWNRLNDNKDALFAELNDEYIKRDELFKKQWKNSLEEKKLLTKHKEILEKLKSQFNILIEHLTEPAEQFKEQGKLIDDYGNLIQKQMDLSRKEKRLPEDHNETIATQTRLFEDLYKLRKKQMELFGKLSKRFNIPFKPLEDQNAESKKYVKFEEKAQRLTDEYFAFINNSILRKAKYES